ncbi:MAG: CoA-disulfide reductase, partial [Acidimicrobiaceae bacterium]|nr:CoA-disulfide reductase [Acidimicrobiaceae bacterium]
VVADRYPNFSICGIPYHLSGAVPDWHSLAHRSHAELEATGMRLRLDTTARRIDPAAHTLLVTGAEGDDEVLEYDSLVLGTGAVPVQPPIAGLSGDGALGPRDGVHLLHSMADCFAVVRGLEEERARRAVIVGAGYIGLELAEALVARGLTVTQFEQLAEVLPTVDPELGALVRHELETRGVEVRCDTAVTGLARAHGDQGRVEVRTRSAQDAHRLVADIVLVVAGVRPDVALAASCGAELGYRGAIAVDRQMRTNLPDVLAAGDCVTTHHRLLGTTYLSLGTTAHKQGRIAGENALGGKAEFAGSLGTQVVKVFERAVARTGLRDHEALAAGFDPVTVEHEADDHKAYYPGSQRITMRWTGDRSTGELLGVQLFGPSDAGVAKRIDVAAAAIFHRMRVDAMSELDLSYTPPLGSPWDALQVGAQAWVRAVWASEREQIVG